MLFFHWFRRVWSNQLHPIAALIPITEI
ncbi:hypothetical protein DSM3645_02933 [Blastopirellula marina DSM 3645]|uniref:Uncharacterized protein n=1 Tax=Blastopirellula marina DSM 3645 TaxID=314230 RepID=A3ZVQ0_9BACT|nr:hypothetical protein DSM3645_02933 [Blastopirellula marina DSM 3645]